MKVFKIVVLNVILAVIGNTVSAQNNDDARALVKQGVQLNDEGKYNEAIDKYHEALKLDPASLYADFELAYTLYASKRGDEGIPYLEKVIAGNTSLTAGAYDILGSIYDSDNQKDKAIEAFKAGIKANARYQRLHYNLGLVYFRYKQYAEAEQCAIEAIKLDPKHASSQRMYALVSFHQNKRVQALMGFCSFIMLEPNTARSAEAYNNIQHILQGGALKNEDGSNTIVLSKNDAQEITTLNTAISLAVLSGKNKNLNGTALLNYELKSIFEITGELGDKKKGNDFFWNYYAAYFYKLAKSSNMETFAYLVSSGTPESRQWITEHPQPIMELLKWEKETERSF